MNVNAPFHSMSGKFLVCGFMLLCFAAFFGQMYTGDCYIVLKTFWNERSELDWILFYWIGKEASVSLCMDHSGYIAYSLYTCVIHSNVLYVLLYVENNYVGLKGGINCYFIRS